MRKVMVDNQPRPAPILPRLVRDKLNRIFHVFRVPPLSGRYNYGWSGEKLREIRARNGVGRPPRRSIADMFVLVGEPTLSVRPAAEFFGLDMPMRAALVEHGSQRAAARALGMNLSTFQRRLAKEQAAA